MKESSLRVAGGGMQVHRDGHEEMPQRNVLGDQVRRRARAGSQERGQLQLLQPQPQARAAAQGNATVKLHTSFDESQ